VAFSICYGWGQCVERKLDVEEPVVQPQVRAGLSPTLNLVSLSIDNPDDKRSKSPGPAVPLSWCYLPDLLWSPVSSREMLSALLSFLDARLPPVLPLLCCVGSCRQDQVLTHPSFGHRHVYSGKRGSQASSLFSGQHCQSSTAVLCLNGSC